MKPSEIWDQIVDDNPWLFPLMVNFPQCRYCGYRQEFKADEEGRVTLSCDHHPDCRINYADAGPIDITEFTGPIRCFH